MLSSLEALIVQVNQLSRLYSLHTLVLPISCPLSSVYDWLDKRLKIQSIADDILSKFVPSHVNIFYCFGGIVFTSFIIQAASGFALTLYYRPTVIEAFASVKFILIKVNLGQFLVQSIDGR